MMLPVDLWQERAEEAERQVAEARKLIALLIRREGGEVRLSPESLVLLTSDVVLSRWDDPATGEVVFRVG